MLYKEGNGTNPVVSIITLLLVFVLVIVMAYFATKFVAKYQGGAINNKNNIRVIESFRIDGNKVIAIIKIAQNYYAVALGKETVTFIDKLNPEDITNIDGYTSTDGTKIDFKSILSQVKNKKSNDNDTK